MVAPYKTYRHRVIPGSLERRRETPTHEGRSVPIHGSSSGVHHSSTDVLYLDGFQKLDITEKDLNFTTSTLTEFTEDSISPLGTIALLVTILEEPR
ncbi:hypothetical protein B296_00052501 [Ensete ventricosum]|uniref:Uncharacterized protein n=1 Tax=Ensete ventricosum TaxID=4639 RepID=A0A426YC89_ENSVE|nr:hypothetical protein B296_00052501 [Ensete ventricosum]